VTPVPRSPGRVAATWTLRVAVVLVALGATGFGVYMLVDTAANARDERARRDAEAGCRPTDDPDSTRNQCLYPDRADRSRNDHEAHPGDAVRLAGYTATLEEASMHLLVLGDQLTLRVSVTNRSDRNRPYGPLDWKVQVDGRAVNPATNERDDALRAGELAPGETVSGTITYDLPRGSYHVLYRPDFFNSARGVWRIDVE
jgi:hypothetical protein